MVHTDRKVVKSFVRWRGRRDESVADTEWSTEWNTRGGTLRCVLVLCTIITKLSACYKYTINYIYTYMEWNVKCVRGDTLQPVWAAASDNQLTALPQSNPLFLPCFPPSDNRDHSRPHRIIIFFFLWVKLQPIQPHCKADAGCVLSWLCQAFPAASTVSLPFFHPSLCSTHFSIYLMNFGFSRGTFHYYSWFIRALLYRSLRIAAQKCANCIWIILPLGLFNKHEVNNG